MHRNAETLIKLIAARGELMRHLVDRRERLASSQLDLRGDIPRPRTLPASVQSAWAIAAVGALFLVGGMTAAPTYGLAGGVAANPGQFPFAVTLTMTGIPTNTGDMHDIACSGALISPDWMITAGHCFHDVNRNRVSGAVPYPTMATFNTTTTNPAASTAISFSLDTVEQSPYADIAIAHLSEASATTIR
jgi:hypothetical protein